MVNRKKGDRVVRGVMSFAASCSVAWMPTFTTEKRNILSLWPKQNKKSTSLSTNMTKQVARSLLMPINMRSQVKTCHIQTLKIPAVQFLSLSMILLQGTLMKKPRIISLQKRCFS